MSNKISEELKSIERIVNEERDKHSLELFDKHEYELQLGEIQKLDQYIHDLNNPIWKPIMYKDKEIKYEISNTGLVRNTKSGHTLSGSITEFGYVKVSLKINNKMFHTFKIHRLVAIAFIPNPDNKPEVNHINGKKILNWVGNLEWTTSAENKHHAIEHGYYDNASFTKLGEERSNAIYTDKQVHEVCKLLEFGKHVKEVSEILGVDEWLPRAIKYNGRWKHISSQYNIPRAGEISKFNTNEKYKSAKLTEEQVHQVCKLLQDGNTSREVSKITGIKESTISPIRLGKAWVYISKTYKIPDSNSRYNEITKYKSKIINSLNYGETDYGKIIQNLELPDTRENRKYIGLIKFKLKKQSSSTIEHSDVGVNTASSSK